MLIFVYGTLKAEGRWHHLLKSDDSRKSLYRGNLSVHGFVLYQNIVPYMYRTNNPEDRVLGEVYAIYDQDVLAAIDRLEGHPNWYRREIISRWKDGSEIQGYVFDKYLSDIPLCPRNELGHYYYEVNEFFK